MSDPLFPYPEFPAPSDVPPGVIDKSKVKYPGGMFDQGDFRPVTFPVRHVPLAAQAAPPRPREVVSRCDCGGHEDFIPGGILQCRRCHKQRRAARS